MDRLIEISSNSWGLQKQISGSKRKFNREEVMTASSCREKRSCTSMKSFETQTLDLFYINGYSGDSISPGQISTETSGDYITIVLFWAVEKSDDFKDEFPVQTQFWFYVSIMLIRVSKIKGMKKLIVCNKRWDSFD